MDPDHTQQQSRDERRRSLRLSLQRTTPPTEPPGYEAQRFLGFGAYGEVWVGVDRNTGRRVAIKFFHHRSGVDWPLLSREVEKLVFLSADRYVVQLLEVGWDAEPPYYVMEYVENGSLNDRLREQGPLPVADAVDLFREIAMGLVHAHGKGVLHCDLKPGNILLDQDMKPRLADFGQSRLSHEQTPALGTLFYMAPEQADLEAVPDARWDVYALGALLYCMLTGQPPHRSEDSVGQIDSAADLPDRLARYREVIHSSPPASRHREKPGMDRALAEIIDRCLSADSDHRYANVQEVLDALRARDAARSRQPLMILGIVGPILLLLIAGLFGWRAYRSAIADSDAAVTQKVKESNAFAAKFVAGLVAREMDRYFRAAEKAAADPELQQLLLGAVEDEDLARLLAQLRQPSGELELLQEARAELAGHPARRALQRRVVALLRDRRNPRAASWFVCDEYGTQVAAAFVAASPRSTIGKNYAYRTYCHGGPKDLDPGQRPLPDVHVARTHLSALLKSTATDTWKVAVSAPILVPDQGKDRFLGVLALTLEIGDFMKFAGTDQQFAVLVDGRAGDHQGVVLQHPLFDEMIQRHGYLPTRFSQYRVPLDGRPRAEAQLYRDPLGADREGKKYDRNWIAAEERVLLERDRSDENRPPTRVDSGLIVLVQEDYGAAIELVHQLGGRLARESLWALAGVICVVGLLWFFVLRAMGERRGGRGPGLPRRRAAGLSHELTTRSVSVGAQTKRE